MQCVFCAVGTEFLNVIWIKFTLQRFKGNVSIFKGMKYSRDVKMLMSRQTVANTDLTDMFPQRLKGYTIQNANSSDLEWSRGL
jgi:hypothetical protein